MWFYLLLTAFSQSPSNVTSTIWENTFSYSRTFPPNGFFYSLFLFYLLNFCGSTPYEGSHSMSPVSTSHSSFSFLFRSILGQSLLIPQSCPLGSFFSLKSSQYVLLSESHVHSKTWGYCSNGISNLCNLSFSPPSSHSLPRLLLRLA